MKVQVNEERCQGHGLCRLSAPHFFFARVEDGHAEVRSEDVPDEEREAVLLAAESCPELAIDVSD